MKTSGLYNALWIFLLCFVLYTVARPQQSSRRTTGYDADSASLMKTDSDFNKLAAEKGTTEAFLTYMAENAVLFPNGSDTVTGRENIRRHLSQGPSDAVLSWQPLSAEIAKSADLGYTYGSYEYRFTGEDGKRAIRYGKYVTVWRKQADGSWRFVADIGNSSPAPSSK